jgi:hypothetical protein
MFLLYLCSDSYQVLTNGWLGCFDQSSVTNGVMI